MDTLPAFASLSENEKIIRTYRCTALRQLFHKPAVGYLSITNKRVVYHSENKSAASKSAVISEIPLEEVGSISTVIGSSINLLSFIGISAVLYVGTLVIKGLFPGVLAGMGVSIVLLLPYLIGLLFEKNIINEELSERILKNLEGSTVDSLIENANWSLLMRIFRYLFLVGMPLFAYNLAFETQFGRQAFLLSFIILLGAYFLIYVSIFGRQRSFGLQVTSKSAGSSGILIHGVAFLALFNRSKTAAKTLSAAPAEDAEIVARELGALILDIQQMGDLGIEKWSRI
jgi:hypothetical protein